MDFHAAFQRLLEAEAASNAACVDQGFGEAYRDFMLAAGFASDDIPPATHLNALCTDRFMPPAPVAPDLNAMRPPPGGGLRWRDPAAPPPEPRSDWAVRIFDPAVDAPLRGRVDRDVAVPDTLLWDLSDMRLLHGGRLITRGVCGYVWGQDHVVTPFSSAYAAQTYREAMTWRGETVRIETRPVIILAPYFFENYYHWFIDFISKLMVFDRFVLPDDAVVAVAHDAPAYVFDSLDHLGLTDRLLRVGPEPLECRRLLIPARRCADHYSNPDHVHWVREQFGVAAAPPGKKRYYISRDGADKRRAVNDAEVSDYLTQRGFTTLRTEKMSFSEQLAAFVEAEALVGVHGAGLLNLLFMPKGAKILELRGDFADLQQWVTYRVAYMFLSHHCEHFHMFVPCPLVGPPDDDQDMRVDLTSLGRALDQAGL